MYSEDLKQEELFRFDYFKCLRSDFAKNECSLCIDLCPEEAMIFDRGRLTLDSGICTACSACMGSCPTEALVNVTFDPNRFTLEFSQQESTKISCKENVPCIAALSCEHLITIALRKKGDFICDLAHCESCSVNKENRVLETIEASIDEAERFLRTSGSEKEIGKEYIIPTEAPEAGRRGFLGKIADAVLNINEDGTMSELMNSGNGKEPLKRILLKNSLKMSLKESGKDTVVEGDFSFFKNKRIDEGSCTNCHECAIFCPTGALSILQDNTGIIFQMGKCISCSICNDVCKPRSIEDFETVDLLDFAFDRMDLLVKHTLEICEECKVAFPYKGGEKICGRCRDFRDHHSDLLMLAKDME